MRITTGLLKGRKILAPPGDAVRPTSDRARQAVFNLLAHGQAARFFENPPPQGLQVLDGFCGTGALGIEALSRGAAYACFMDYDVKTARANASAMGVMAQCDFIMGDITAPPPAAQKFDLLFLDPPYGKNLLPAAIAGLWRENWLEAGAIVIAELGRDENLPLPADFTVLDNRRYGAAQIVICRCPLPAGE
jgi:16S rRNA (guanine966-N2)-methyltransferase